MPSIQQALLRLERELSQVRQKKTIALKLIHGYGSSGMGGDIRLAVQRRLRELVDAGEVRACIFGEHWSRSDEVSWRLIQEHPELKGDSDLGRANQGITIVIL